MDLFEVRSSKIENTVSSIADVQVLGIDPNSKSVKLASGDQIQYTTLVLATGGTPRTLTCPGADLSNVCYLRTPADGQKISKIVAGKKVVVIGSSFIGN